MSNISSRICLHFMSPSVVCWQASEAGEGAGREGKSYQQWRMITLAGSFEYWSMWSLFSHVRLFATPWTGAHQAPLSMGFSRQEYWSGLPCSPSGDPPNPGTEPTSLIKSPALGGGFFTKSTTWGVFWDCVCMLNPSSRVWLCVTLWTVALQAPLSKGLSRQEYWSGLPFPSPEYLAPNVMLTILFSPK